MGTDLTTFTPALPMRFVPTKGAARGEACDQISIASGPIDRLYFSVVTIGSVP